MGYGRAERSTIRPAGKAASLPMGKRRRSTPPKLCQRMVRGKATARCTLSDSITGVRRDVLLATYSTSTNYNQYLASQRFLLTSVCRFDDTQGMNDEDTQVSINLKGHPANILRAMAESEERTMTNFLIVLLKREWERRQKSEPVGQRIDAVA